MNRFLIAVRRTPIIIVLLILLVVYMPPAILLAPETERNALVTALGIDREGEELSLSLMCFVPQANQNYAEKFQVVTCTSSSVSEGLEKASTILGRNANLNHIETIILAEELLNEDVSHLLDHFARTSIVQSGCLLAMTNGKAKDTIKLINNLNTKTGVKIEDIFRYSEKTFYGRETTIESFYSGYYSPTSTSFMAYIEAHGAEAGGLTDDEQSSSGQEGAGGGHSSSSNSGGGPENQQHKSLSNTGKMVVLKQGLKKDILDIRDIVGLNFVMSNNDRGTIKIEDIELEEGKKSDLIYQIIENKTFSNIKFHNNIPVVRYKVRLKLDLFEVVDKEYSKNPSIDEYTMDKKITNAIEKKVKKEFASALQKLRDSKTDALQIYEKLERADRAQFKLFLDSLEDREDFLNKVVFSVSVESSQF